MPLTSAHANLIGLYVPKVKKGTISLPGGANPYQAEVLFEDGKPVFFGTLKVQLPAGATLSSLIVFFEHRSTDTQTGPLRIYEHDLLEAAGVDGGVYSISSDHFTSGGNIELSLTGFRLVASSSDPGSVLYTATYAVPLTYYIP